MRNRMRPDTKLSGHRVLQPQMPNQYTGPYGSPPKDHAPAPYWYMKNKKENPMEQTALLKAFQNAGKPVQSKVNHQRRPADAMRGY